MGHRQGPWYCHSAHSLPRTVSAAKVVGNREEARTFQRRGGLSAPALRVRAGRSAGHLQANHMFLKSFTIIPPDEGERKAIG